MLQLSNARIAIIGLGYVGLPLAVEFGKHFPTLGFDINAERIQELKSGRDRTLEVDSAELAAAPLLRYASDTAQLKDATPISSQFPLPSTSTSGPTSRRCTVQANCLVRSLKRAT